MMSIELGINRMQIGGVLRANGFGGKPTADDNMRCPKCREKGHQAAECPTGDALDRLDREAGWVEPEAKQTTMSLHDFVECKMAQSHDISALQVSIEKPHLDRKDVELAYRCRDYDVYLEMHP